MIVDRINSNLGALFNTDNAIYKSVIAYNNYEEEYAVFDTAIFDTAVFATEKPTKWNIGAIASQFEYLRQLGIYYLEQMYIDTANTEFLKYYFNNFFGTYRLEDETDEEWIQRTFVSVFQQKVSTASIIYSLNPYSSQTPIIDRVVDESAFADFSYADVYVSDTTTYEGETVYVLPAVSESELSSLFTIRITLYDTASEDIFTVQSILDNILAAGIIYVLQIIYS